MEVFVPPKSECKCIAQQRENTTPTFLSLVTEAIVPLLPGLTSSSLEPALHHHLDFALRLQQRALSQRSKPYGKLHSFREHTQKQRKIIFSCLEQSAAFEVQ